MQHIVLSIIVMLYTANVVEVFDAEKDVWTACKLYLLLTSMLKLPREDTDSS